MNLSKKSLQFITAAAVIFLVLLLIALLINVVRLASERRRLRELEAMLIECQTLSAQLEGDIELLSSDEYIELYARAFLNMKNAGEQAFEGK